MNNLKEFIRNFFSNKGQYVFMSLLIAKICGFISSVVTVRLLSQENYGVITIVASVFAVFTTFSGFGSTQGLLRFGALSNDDDEKNKLNQYFFYKGFLYQIFLSVIFLISSLFFVKKYEDILMIFGFFTIRLIGFYFFNHIQSYFRIHYNNKSFSVVNNFVNILGVILLVFFTYFFGLKGYLLAITITPFLSLYWFFKLKIFSFTKIKLDNKELWQYSFHAVITAFFSDFLFSLDILLLGFLMNENAVASYKVAIILPSNLTFLAVSMLQADFPKLAQQSANKSFIKNYIKNYYKIFIPICGLIFGVGFIFSKEILVFFFGKTYSNQAETFTLLLIAFLMNMLLRNLYGNLLSAVGMMKSNTITSIITLLVLLGSAFILVPKFQILGMGISVLFAMVFSGILAFAFFINYLKKLN